MKNLLPRESVAHTTSDSAAIPQTGRGMLKMTASQGDAMLLLMTNAVPKLLKARHLECNC